MEILAQIFETMINGIYDFTIFAVAGNVWALSGNPNGCDGRCNNGFTAMGGIDSDA